MRLTRLFCVLVGLVLVLPMGAGADGRTIHVRSGAQFAEAVAELRDRGGTIRLHRRHYRELVVPSRSTRPLRIVGERGVVVESLVLERTRNVTVRRVTIAPLTQDAWLKIYGSKRIELDDILVTAARTRYRATVHIPSSSHVLIRRSEFRRCGDRSELFSNCIHLQQRARHVLIADNWFHDCRGCDFIHGHFGYGLTLRGNRFERALPCRMSRHRCGHQDLVSLWSGSKLLVEGNTFGVYKKGAAQLYLIGAVDRVSIVNNVFVGTDRKVPGYRARVAIIIGSKGSKRVPRRVRVVNNTILTGARRIDGYAGSIRMSGVYWRMQRSKRPLLANNVIGLVENPHHVCSVTRAAISNVVLRGSRCLGSNRLGRAHLDASGRPTAKSDLLIDRANRRLGSQRDIVGRPRGDRPDIGAYEYRARSPRAEAHGAVSRGGCSRSATVSSRPVAARRLSASATSSSMSAADLAGVGSNGPVDAARTMTPARWVEAGRRERALVTLQAEHRRVGAASHSAARPAAVSSQRPSALKSTSRTSEL